MYYNALVKGEGVTIRYDNIKYPDKFVKWLEDNVYFVTVFFYEKRTRKQTNGTYCGSYSKKNGFSFRTK